MREVIIIGPRKPQLLNHLKYYLNKWYIKIKLILNLNKAIYLLREFIKITLFNYLVY
jgi:hypothetical protein